MGKMFLEVFNEGISPKEMNAVRGGAADPLCTCAGGSFYDCGCYDRDCTCHGSSQLICSCKSTIANNKPVVGPTTCPTKTVEACPSNK